MDKHQTAKNFFRQLTEFSHQYIKTRVGINQVTSLWGQSSFRHDAPKGAIIHYTASGSLDGTVRWFCDHRLQSKVSAHVVVARSRLESAEGIVEQYPLIDSLPVTVVQCRPYDKPAYHATWANKYCYGIENVNYGQVNPTDDGWVTWTGNTLNPLEYNILKHANQGYEAYTQAQVAANIMVLRHLNNLLGDGVLQKSWILGHEQVQGIHTAGANGYDKRDPGPFFPLEYVREAVYSEYCPVSHLPWLRNFDLNPERNQDWQNDVFNDYYALIETKELSQRTVKSDLIALIGDRDSFPSHMRWALINTCLKLLGYHIPGDITDNMLTAGHLESIWLFQKMMGLKTDQIVGPITTNALSMRLMDRHIFG
jgi:N-acetyl-anhydromuramyl-L-alanine amidase AmpD